MVFSDFWGVLQSNLRPGDVIRNWTAARGYLGDTFEVVLVKSDCVVSQAPNAETFQRVPRKDFDLIYRKWGDYIAGTVLRKEFMTDTRVSKYTISIISHLIT